MEENKIKTILIVSFLYYIFHLLPPEKTQLTGRNLGSFDEVLPCGLEEAHPKFPTNFYLFTCFLYMKRRYDKGNLQSRSFISLHLIKNSLPPCAACIMY